MKINQCSDSNWEVQLNDLCVCGKLWYFKCLRLSETPARGRMCVVGGTEVYVLWKNAWRSGITSESTSSDTRHWYVSSWIEPQSIIRGTMDPTRGIGTLGTVDTSICASWVCELSSALLRTWILIQHNFVAWLFASGTLVLHYHGCTRNY